MSGLVSSSTRTSVIYSGAPLPPTRRRDGPQARAAAHPVPNGPRDGSAARPRAPSSRRASSARSLGKLHPARRRDNLTTPSYDSPKTSRCACPFVDGHGNFGSLDDGPAAARYTGRPFAPKRSRWSTASNEMFSSTSFPTTTTSSPSLPCSLPHSPTLLVNGAERASRSAWQPQHGAAQPHTRSPRRPPPAQSSRRESRRSHGLRAGPRPADRRHYPRPRRCGATLTRRVAAASRRGRRSRSSPSRRARPASSSPSCRISSAREGHREDQRRRAVKEARGHQRWSTTSPTAATACASSSASKRPASTRKAVSRQL